MDDEKVLVDGEPLDRGPTVDDRSLPGTPVLRPVRVARASVPRQSHARGGRVVVRYENADGSASMPLPPL